MRTLTDFSMRNIFIEYNGDGLYFGLYLAALVYILVCGSKKEKLIFISTPLFMIVTIFNPLLAPIAMRIFGEDETYYRFFWVLPIGILLAYSFCKIIIVQNRLKNQITISIACILCVLISGTFISQYRPLQSVVNPYKVSSALIEIVSLLHEEHNNLFPDNEEEIMAVVPADFLFDIRSYDASIRLAYGRNEILGFSTPRNKENMIVLVNAFYNNVVVDESDLARALLEEEVNYIIVPSHFSSAEILKSFEMTLIAEIESFFVFKN